MTDRRLVIARTLLLAGIGVGLLSWRETASHIVDSSYILAAGFPSGPDHARYHALRETAEDVAMMIVFLTAFFGPRALRTRQTWWLLLVLMAGYYLPFWIGMPFDRALAAPSAIANLIHVGMAALVVGALFVARPSFATEHTLPAGL